MKYYFSILILGVVIYLVLTPKDLMLSLGLKQIPELESSSAVVASREPALEKAIFKENLPSKISNSVISNNLVTGKNEESLPNEKRTKNFQLLLQIIAPCLELKNRVELSSTEPKIDNLLTSLQGELGDPIIRSEDWTSTEIETSNNEKKLIKIETSYENEDIVKKLKYYNVTDEGLFPIDLSEDQATEPTPTFIASLESEGKISKTEKSERVFFQNGEEVIYTEKNGFVDFIEISRQGKVIKCSSLEKTECVCK